MKRIPTPIRVICCGAILFIGLSCSEDHRKHAVRAEARSVEWKFPTDSNIVYPGAAHIEVSRGGEYLVCNYSTRVENEYASAVCIVDLVRGESAWSVMPFYARPVCPVFDGVWAVFVGIQERDPMAGGYFLELDSMQRTGPDIPIGAPIVREGISVCGVCIFDSETQETDDIWLCDLRSGAQRFLSRSKHTLRNVQVAVWPNRIVITGRPAEADESYEGITTQLWSFPELKKISEYEGTEHFPWKSLWRARAVGDDSFCFALAPGLRKVADLETGKVRFSIGHVVPEKVWIDLGHDPIHVMEGCGYVQGTGLMVSLEQFTNTEEREIRTYDAKTGEQRRVTKVSSRNLEEAMITKVDGEWILLCGYTDPGRYKDVPIEQLTSSPDTMWLTPFRLKDLAKGKNSIEIIWDGLHSPVVAGGRVLAVFKDHCRIVDLSAVVRF